MFCASFFDYATTTTGQNLKPIEVFPAKAVLINLSSVCTSMVTDLQDRDFCCYLNVITGCLKIVTELLIPRLFNRGLGVVHNYD